MRVSTTNNNPNRKALIADAKTNKWKVVYSYSGKTIDFSKTKKRKARSSNPFGMPRGFGMPRF